MPLITLIVFDNIIEAHLVKSKLESEGITAYLFDENINTMYPLYNIATGGIKLKTDEADVEKAQKILTEINNNQYSDTNNQILSCPECGSKDLYNNFKSMKGIKGIFSAVFSFLSMTFPIYYKVVYKCKSCGHEFRPVENQAVNS